jgi:hypothetical protein
VVGAPLAQASVGITGAGFPKPTVTYVSNMGDLCLVTGETPNGNQQVDVTTTVQLTVAGDPNTCPAP